MSPQPDEISLKVVSHESNTSRTHRLAITPVLAADSPPTTTKEGLKNEVAGVCKNPEQAFPTPPPREKLDELNQWCTRVIAAIDKIPEEKLQQVAAETAEEYSQYKADPKGFVPVKEYSMIRISKQCVPKR